jgi:hypothetical protein
MKAIPCHIHTASLIRHAGFFHSERNAPKIRQLTKINADTQATLEVVFFRPYESKS